MVDAVVQVPPIPGTTGQPNQQIDTSAITRADGTLVERQRVVIGDPINPTMFGDITPLGALAIDTIGAVNLAQIASTLEYHSALLEAILIQLGGIVPTRTN